MQWIKIVPQKKAKSCEIAQHIQIPGLASMEIGPIVAWILKLGGIPIFQYIAVLNSNRYDYIDFLSEPVHRTSGISSINYKPVASRGTYSIAICAFKSNCTFCSCHCCSRSAR